jgi:hypothetical protein
MSKFVLSLGIIVAGLLGGYIVQLFARRQQTTCTTTTTTRSTAATTSSSASNGSTTSSTSNGPILVRTRRTIQRIALLGMSSITTASALWAFEPQGARIATLPVLGLAALFTGGSIGLVLGRVLRLGTRSAGALFTVSGMSNIGSIAALLVYLFLGERGFAVVPLYRLFEELAYYSIAFPIARSFGGAAARRRSLADILLDPFILASISATAIGFSLNLLGVPRPAFFATVNAVLVPTGSFLLLSSIGMAMRFGRIKAYVREALLVSAVKYVAVPAVVLGLAVLLGLGRTADHTVFKALIILASAPVGFIALVPPSLYDLDVDLANAAWLGSMILLLVAVIPVQLLVIGLIG